MRRTHLQIKALATELNQLKGTVIVDNITIGMTDGYGRTLYDINEGLELLAEGLPAGEAHAMLKGMLYERSAHHDYIETLADMKRKTDQQLTEADAWIKDTNATIKSLKKKLTLKDETVENLKKNIQRLMEENKRLQQVIPIIVPPPPGAKVNSTNEPPITYENLKAAGWTDRAILTFNNGQYADLMPINIRTISSIVTIMMSGY